MIGVYKIVNIITGDYYIGSSKDIDFRFSRHCMFLKNQKHVNRYLQNAWNKYSEASFKLEVIEECTLENIFVREQYYIDTLTPKYNLSPLVQRPPDVTGRRWTEERKKKLSNSNKGRKHSLEAREKMRISRGGRGPGEECISKLYKEVAQLDKRTGEIIRTYKSVQEATNIVGNGRCKSTIAKCAQGVNQTAFGFRWKYITE